MRRRRTLAPAVALVAAGVALATVSMTRTHTSSPRALPHQFAAGSSSTNGTVTTRTRSLLPTAVAPAASHNQAADGSSTPVRVRIAALHVDAPVVPVGAAGGQIDIPALPSTLGWWIGGPAPGAATGTAVLVGHVDSAASGPGALFHLDKLTRGQTVTVRASDGRSVSYRVAALQVVMKTRGLPATLFATDAPGRLVIITCGGPFDEGTKSYEDNVIAVAQRT